jgi:hypothetical protein
MSAEPPSADDIGGGLKYHSRAGSNFPQIWLRYLIKRPGTRLDSAGRLAFTMPADKTNTPGEAPWRES